MQQQNAAPISIIDLMEIHYPLSIKQTKSTAVKLIFSSPTSLFDAKSTIGALRFILFSSNFICIGKAAIFVAEATSLKCVVIS